MSTFVNTALQLSFCAYCCSQLYVADAAHAEAEIVLPGSEMEVASIELATSNDTLRPTDLLADPTTAPTTTSSHMPDPLQPPPASADVPTTYPTMPTSPHAPAPMPTMPVLPGTPVGPPASTTTSNCPGQPEPYEIIEILCEGLWHEPTVTWTPAGPTGALKVVAAPIGSFGGQFTISGELERDEYYVCVNGTWEYERSFLSARYKLTQLGFEENLEVFDKVKFCQHSESHHIFSPGKPNFSLSVETTIADQKQKNDILRHSEISTNTQFKQKLSDFESEHVFRVKNTSSYFPDGTRSAASVKQDERIQEQKNEQLSYYSEWQGSQEVNYLLNGRKESESGDYQIRKPSSTGEITGKWSAQYSATGSGILSGLEASVTRDNVSTSGLILELSPNDVVHALQVSGHPGIVPLPLSATAVSDALAVINEIRSIEQSLMRLNLTAIPYVQSLENLAMPVPTYPDPIGFQVPAPASDLPFVP